MFLFLAVKSYWCPGVTHFLYPDGCCSGGSTHCCCWADFRLGVCRLLRLRILAVVLPNEAGWACWDNDRFHRPSADNPNRDVPNVGEASVDTPIPDSNHRTRGDTRDRTNLRTKDRTNLNSIRIRCSSPDRPSPDSDSS